MPGKPCQAQDPRICRYHGALIRAEEAQKNGDVNAYIELRAEADKKKRDAAVKRSTAGTASPRKKIIKKVETKIQDSTHTKAYPPVETIGEPWEVYPLTVEEDKLLRKRLRGQFLTSEMKRMKIDAETDTFVSFNRNGEASFSYQEYGAQDVFMRGGCGYIAYALHEKTGLPVTVFTKDSTEEYWQGHVAIKMGPDKFLDISGFSNAADIRSYFGFNGDENFTMHDVDNDADLRKALGVEPKDDVYKDLAPLERAMLKRYTRDIIRDYIQNPEWK